MALHLLKFTPPSEDVLLKRIIVPSKGRIVEVPERKEIILGTARSFTVMINQRWLLEEAPGKIFSFWYRLKFRLDSNGKIIEIPLKVELTLARNFSAATPRMLCDMIFSCKTFRKTKPGSSHVFSLKELLEEYIFDYSKIDKDTRAYFLQEIRDLAVSFLEGELKHTDLIEDLSSEVLLVHSDRIFSNIAINREESLKEKITLYDETSRFEIPESFNKILELQL